MAELIDLYGPSGHIRSDNGSPAVVLKHYAQLRDVDYRKTASKAVQQMAAGGKVV
ncbi:MAG: hypothetical protein KTR15_07345 [Phycisphaeraceae bacterium]|nr:hypothetical protein [Phycisphaeraceae bacterium]